MAFGRGKFGRKVRSTLKIRHLKFYDLISKIHEKNPKKHTPPPKPPFFFGGGVGSEMNKTRQHRRGVQFIIAFILSFFSKENELSEILEKNNEENENLLIEIQRLRGHMTENLHLTTAYRKEKTNLGNNIPNIEKIMKETENLKKEIQESQHQQVIFSRNIFGVKHA